MKKIKNIEVRDVPEMTLAYVRHTGPYQGDVMLFDSYGKSFLPGPVSVI